MGKGEYDNQGYPMQSYDQGPPAGGGGYGQGYPGNPPVGGGGYGQGYPGNPPAGGGGYGYGGNANVQGGNQNTTNVIQVQAGLPQPQGPTTVIIQQEERMPSMAGHIAFSCVVFWFCNCLFGCIAFFIAIGGLNAGSPAEARSLGRASQGMNIAGIVISLITVGIILGLYFTGIIFPYGYFYG